MPVPMEYYNKNIRKQCVVFSEKVQFLMEIGVTNIGFVRCHRALW